ncbi:hypothetical protein M9Y10_040825 [Tritrichomonas musculus]|uniref:LisH domain-containing protein n=1 Tax=Tritrichomonas musculus TaxID=1915356 RepID=A0ABR2K4H6_9EUKA
MSFIEQFQQIFREVQNVIDTKQIKEQVIKEARDRATDAIISLKQTKTLSKNLEVHKINANSEDERDELLLILEFFESSGYIFGVPILSYESQNPDLIVDRIDLANRLGLDPNDPQPLLIQMIKPILKETENGEA